MRRPNVWVIAENWSRQDGAGRSVYVGFTNGEGRVRIAAVCNAPLARFESTRRERFCRPSSRRSAQACASFVVSMSSKVSYSLGAYTFLPTESGFPRQAAWPWKSSAGSAMPERSGSLEERLQPPEASQLSRLSGLGRVRRGVGGIHLGQDIGSYRARGC